MTKDPALAVAKTLRRAFREAVHEFDLGERVREALDGRPRERILAVGKAATRMLAGAWDRTSRSGLVVVPEGTRIAWLPPQVEVAFSAHPAPTDASLRAAAKARAFVSHGDTLVLMSGGASALLAEPALGITLDEKVVAVATLMDSGAAITDVNLARRHLSTLKGGGLARCATGSLLTLVASDVIAGGLHEVGSGPTVPDPTTAAEARELLDRHAIDLPVIETLKAEEAAARRLEARQVACPRDLAEAVGAKLRGEGLEVHVWPESGEDVTGLSRAYVGFARQLTKGQAVVRAAEPTIRLGAIRHSGGRSTHLAALVGPQLPDDVAFLAGASDGQDGSSESAGAVVTKGSLAEHDVASAVSCYDTARLHRAAWTLLESRGPSGLNLCDVHVVARAP